MHLIELDWAVEQLPVAILVKVICLVHVNDLLELWLYQLSFEFLILAVLDGDDTTKIQIFVDFHI